MKKKKTVTNDKVLKRSLPRGGYITLKPQRETKVCVTDVLHVLQLCFLCFTLLKAMLLYHIFTGFSPVSLTRLHPWANWFLFRCPSFPLRLPFNFSFLKFVPLSRSVSRGRRVQEVSLSAESSVSSSCWSQTKHRKKMCRFCWWCACTCVTAPSFAPAPHLSPLPPPSDVSERSGMS